MASRKGVEPLTPGLGNLCSIQLSYRDWYAEPCHLSGTSAPRASPENLIRIVLPIQEAGAVALPTSTGLDVSPHALPVRLAIS